MAGLTQNNAPEDADWFKTRFNLAKKSSEIAQNIDFLKGLFSKLYSKNGTLKFKNFNRLHNQVRLAQGKPKASQRLAQNRIDIDKNRIDKNIKYGGKSPHNNNIIKGNKGASPLKIAVEQNPELKKVTDKIGVEPCKRPK